MSKFIISLILLSVLGNHTANAEDTDVLKEISSLKSEMVTLKAGQIQLVEEQNLLQRKLKDAGARIDTLKDINANLSKGLDSVQCCYNALADSQKADKTELSSSISQTNEKVQATENVVSARTLWGVCGMIVLLIALLATIWAFLRRFRTGNTSIDEVRKAQDALTVAHKKMQEESVQLDNKLIELLSKQDISASTTVAETGEIDHSLTLKVADEIVRIEMNLSRMDESIKGYKQLAKAVQRIKENFMANDYEIVDMLGKQYQAGMKAIATFITDETLEEGQQIITRIIKPQVNYKQVMIQAAQIEVSQSE